jgi:hypothetical protein
VGQRCCGVLVDQAPQVESQLQKSADHRPESNVAEVQLLPSAQIRTGEYHRWIPNVTELAFGRTAPLASATKTAVLPKSAALMTVKRRIESDLPTSRFTIQFLTVRGISKVLPGPTPKANTPPLWRVLEFRHTSCAQYLMLRASRRLPRLMECQSGAQAACRHER